MCYRPILNLLLCTVLSDLRRSIQAGVFTRQSGAFPCKLDDCRHLAIIRKQSSITFNELHYKTDVAGFCSQLWPLLLSTSLFSPNLSVCQSMSVCLSVCLTTCLSVCLSSPLLRAACVLPFSTSFLSSPLLLMLNFYYSESLP